MYYVTKLISMVALQMPSISIKINSGCYIIRIEPFPHQLMLKLTRLVCEEKPNFFVISYKCSYTCPEVFQERLWKVYSKFTAYIAIVKFLRKKQRVNQGLWTQEGMQLQIKCTHVPMLPVMTFLTFSTVTIVVKVLYAWNINFS